MKEDTRKLLRECTSGCRMAIGSMKQVEAYIKDSKLRIIIDSYREKHETLEREAAILLKASGIEEKEPNTMAQTFSWFKTNMKLMLETDSHQIAKLMMDGCNMGIQSISEYKNKYTAADEKAQDIAGRLIRLEEDFMVEMKQFV